MESGNLIDSSGGGEDDMLTRDNWADHLIGFPLPVDEPSQLSIWINTAIQEPIVPPRPDHARGTKGTS